MNKKNLKTMRASFSIVMSLLLLFGLNVPALAANNSSAVYTTTSSGEAINGNQYESKQDTYIRFGSQLPDGEWTVVVSQPGGDELGSGTADVTISERVFNLWDITLFSDSTSGVYKVEATITEVNNGGQETTTRKSDNFSVVDPDDGDGDDPDDGDGDDPDDGDGDDPDDGDGDDPDDGDGDDPDDGDGDDPDDGDGDDPDDGDGDDSQDEERKPRRRRDRDDDDKEEVAVVVPVEETPKGIVLGETDEKVDPAPVIEEVEVPVKTPLALPHTGVTHEGLIGLSMLLMSGSLLVVRKKL